MVDRIGRGVATSAEAGVRSLIENIMKAIDRKVDCFCEEHPLLAEIVAAIFGHILMVAATAVVLFIIGGACANYPYLLGANAGPDGEKGVITAVIFVVAAIWMAVALIKMLAPIVRELLYCATKRS